MSTNYFGEGLRAKLGEFKLKYEALAKDADISEKTVRRAIKGDEVDEATKQSIVGALGTSIEMLEWLGRSRILSRIWVPPERKEKDVYELTEILDAHHLFRALSGKIEGYGITLPQLETESVESITIARTDFELLARLQEFLISLMLIAPVDPVNATGWDPTDWDKRLKDLAAMKYVLFIGVNRPHSRIINSLKQMIGQSRSKLNTLEPPFGIYRIRWRMRLTELTNTNSIWKQNESNGQINDIRLALFTTRIHLRLFGKGDGSYQSFELQD